MIVEKLSAEPNRVTQATRSLSFLFSITSSSARALYFRQSGSRYFGGERHDRIILGGEKLEEKFDELYRSVTEEES